VKSKVNEVSIAQSLPCQQLLVSHHQQIGELKVLSQVYPDFM